MQFYFIRHGQSTNNLLWQRVGSSQGRSEDPELSAVGRRQAEILAQHLRQSNPNVATRDHDNQNLAGFGITHLYASLMVRSLATGTAIAQALDLPLIAWDDIHERGGIWLEDDGTGERLGQPGKNRAFLEALYPHVVLPPSLGDAGWWGRPYETAEQWATRAQRFLRELSERHGGTKDRVAVISHAGFYNELMTRLLALPTQNGYWFALNNAAITRIDFHVDGTVLVYSNRVDFLPAELVT